MKNRKALLITALAALSIYILLTVQVPTKQGVNYNVRVYRIPLYIKLIEFIDRDYRYRALSRSITSEADNGEAKILAIYEWVRANIKTDIPRGWTIYDDHILNIIIRGYGAPDQINDVFTTLCYYAGFPAGWTRVGVAGYRGKLILSFVRVDKRWLIFDLYRGVYFKNDRGKIASVDDISSSRCDKNEISKAVGNTGLTYADYMKGLDIYTKDIALRSRKQVPYERLIHEIKVFFNPKKRLEDEQHEEMPYMPE